MRSKTLGGKFPRRYHGLEDFEAFFRMNTMTFLAEIKSQSTATVRHQGSILYSQLRLSKLQGDELHATAEVARLRV